MLVLDRPAPNGFDELLELRLEFPFNLIGAYSNPGTQVVAQNRDFGAVSQTDFTRSYAPSVAQAILSLVR